MGSVSSKESRRASIFLLAPSCVSELAGVDRAGRSIHHDPSPVSLTFTALGRMREAGCRSMSVGGVGRVGEGGGVCCMYTSCWSMYGKEGA